MRTALLAVGCTGMLGATAAAQNVAVYESEANAAEYRGIYQEPLRAWLQSRDIAFEVIGDAVAEDGAALAEYDLVLAASVYLIPDAGATGLVQYLHDGGRVIWLDSPARCRLPDFRAAVGLGPDTRYSPLREVTFRRVGDTHPAALSVEEQTVARSVGNAAVQAADGASVLYETQGLAPDGEEVALPAVFLARPGNGLALVYNWIPPNPALDPLLADGLDFMLADVRLGDQPLVLAPRAVAPVLHQPEPLATDIRIYRRAETAEPQLRLSVVLAAPDGKELTAETSGPPTWTAPEGDVMAGVARVRLRTTGLPDGTYTVRVAARADGIDEQAELEVQLTGERWAAIERAKRERRRELEPRLLGTLGDYDAEPRTPEGRVDLPRLLEQIETAHMTMYDFLIWHAPTDWEDFQTFLPLAQERGLKVWVTLCPPSEQGAGMPWSEPYRLDYLTWAEEIGKLSAEYDNLVAFVVDDFWSGQNHSLFTPEYIARMVEALRKHNPKLAFLPTIYWDTIGDEDWIEAYGPLIDGIVFPYCEYVTGDELAEQLAACRQWIGPDKFLLVNVYAAGSGGADAPPRTAEYMRKTLILSREQSDGIRIYCLPKESLLEDEIYAVTAELYGEWRGEE